MSKDFEEKNHESSSSDNLYSDYPKDIVKVMMENHPFRKDEQAAEDKDMERDNKFEKTIKNENEDVYSPSRRGMMEKQTKDVSEDDLSSLKFNPNTYFDERDKKEDKNFNDGRERENVDKEKLHKEKHTKKASREDMPVLDDSNFLGDELDDIMGIGQKKKTSKIPADEEEQVQVVRHKEMPKKFKKDFKDTDKNDFEEIKKHILEEKRERRENMENGGMKNGHLPHKKDTYNEMQYKKRRNKKNETLDLLRTPSESRKMRQQSNKTAVGKKVIIAAGVAVFLFLFLFVRNITLTHKVNELNTKLADYQDMKQKNEDYKLEVLSLQDKLKTNATSSEENTNSDENSNQKSNTGGSAETADTYTVVAGDTLSGISQKVYGNYSGYQKILEANGLTENSSLQIGQTLKIPKK
jgi:LysM repeat protein